VAAIGLVSREDERYGAARVIKRSHLFFTVPIALILVTSANFIWEITRANLNTHTLSTWPFRFTITNVSTTATILAVFVTLFMGRLQWARALRPVVGFAIDDEGAKFLPSSDKWRVWIYNAGPGGAVVENLSYYVRFVDQPEDQSPTNWVPLAVVNDQLRSRNLRDGTDYFIRWNSRGAPFPAVQKYAEGMQLAWFTSQALAQMRILDIRLRYVDSLGDTYEKICPMRQRLPSVTVEAIRNVVPTS
jgi:hypothetical protein